jgi:hypothetical protein
MDELINTLENLRSQLDIPDLSSSEFAIKIKNDITLDLYFYDLIKCGKIPNTNNMRPVQTYEIIKTQYIQNQKKLGKWPTIDLTRLTTSIRTTEFPYLEEYYAEYSKIVNIMKRYLNNTPDKIFNPDSLFLTQVILSSYPVHIDNLAKLLMMVS